MRTHTSRCFAIVPAAGSGSRKGGEEPKQYLSLLGQPLSRHSRGARGASQVMERDNVGLSVSDGEW
ncbi:2-C-methyl-D-erythritol 4-phosphate cytidylyltransferase, partial [Thauera aminoaromatica]